VWCALSVCVVLCHDGVLQSDLPVPVPTQHYILDADDEPTEIREKTPQPSMSMDADFTADL
jgi:hypothetical protein